MSNKERMQRINKQADSWLMSNKGEVQSVNEGSSAEVTKTKQGLYILCPATASGLEHPKSASSLLTRFILLGIAKIEAP